MQHRSSFVSVFFYKRKERESLFCEQAQSERPPHGQPRKRRVDPPTRKKEREGRTSLASRPSRCASPRHHVSRRHHRFSRPHAKPLHKLAPVHKEWIFVALLRARDTAARPLALHGEGTWGFPLLWRARACALDRLLSSHGRSGQRAHAPERRRNRRSCSPLLLHSLSSPHVTDRVIKHANTRQGLLAAVAKRDGEKRGTSGAGGLEVRPFSQRFSLLASQRDQGGRRRHAAATSTLPAPFKPCTVA
jgi:hypothetical protein